MEVVGGGRTGRNDSDIQMGKVAMLNINDLDGSRSGAINDTSKTPDKHDRKVTGMSDIFDDDDFSINTNTNTQFDQYSNTDDIFG